MNGYLVLTGTFSDTLYSYSLGPRDEVVVSGEEIGGCAGA